MSHPPPTPGTDRSGSTVARSDVARTDVARTDVADDVADPNGSGSNGSGGHPSRTVLGTVAGVVVELVRRVLVQPVRNGRLRRDGWPLGLTPVVAIGLVVYLVAMTLATVAGTARGRLPHDNPSGFPAALLPVMLIATSIVAALAVTGSLHAPRPVRLLGLLLPLLGVFPIGLWTTAQNWWAILPASGGWVILTGFALWRWRSSPVWWEYAVVQGLLGASSLASTWLALRPGLRRGYLDAGTVTQELLISLAVFALPTAVLAGMALSELAFSTSVWLTESISARVPARVTAVLTVAVAALAAVSGVLRWQDRRLGPDNVSAAAVAVALVALAGAGWWFLDRLADRRSSRGPAEDQPTPERSDRHSPDRHSPDSHSPESQSPDSTSLIRLAQSARLIGGVAAGVITLPTVLALIVLLISYGLAAVSDRFGLTSPSVLFGTVLTAPPAAERAVGYLLAFVIALPASVALARRGRRGAAELSLVIGLICALAGADDLGVLAMPSLTELGLAALLPVLALVLIWSIRRRLTARRVEALLAALLLSIAVTNRELLSDPLGLVLGGASGALLTIGLIWALLTGAEDANTGTPSFPRSSRTLLVVAGLALTALVFAHNQVAVSGLLQLEDYVGDGTAVLGTGLILAGLWAVLAAGGRNEEVREPVTPDAGPAEPSAPPSAPPAGPAEPSTPPAGPPAGPTPGPPQNRTA